MEDNLISIIVPVYNVEEYLPECLDSIINQTYSNFEAILVDDGSTDASEPSAMTIVSRTDGSGLFTRKMQALASPAILDWTMPRGRMSNSWTVMIRSCLICWNLPLR